VIVGCVFAILAASLFSAGPGRVRSRRDGPDADGCTGG